MKVLNLQCAQHHSFEGWFGSEDDFQAQLARGLVDCPMCGDSAVQKMPSAPRLNLGLGQAQTAAASAALAPGDGSASTAVVSAPASTGMATTAEQAAFLKALRHVIKSTEDVGDRFADEARRMHYGDTETRNIRGQASVSEAVALLEEGIDVMPLPLPAALKETLQ
ncbi:MAG: hypothetical protein JWQ72_1647 [Polaromonas sp.]|nr:hypothetical protein [Polaromonas sp.]